MMQRTRMSSPKYPRRYSRYHLKNPLAYKIDLYVFWTICTCFIVQKDEERAQRVLEEKAEAEYRGTKAFNLYSTTPLASKHYVRNTISIGIPLSSLMPIAMEAAFMEELGVSSTEATTKPGPAKQSLPFFFFNLCINLHLLFRSFLNSPNPLRCRSRGQ